MVSRLSGLVGAAATLGWTVSNLGCCGAVVGPAGAMAAATGLLATSMSSWGYDLMYAALTLTLAALGLNAWHSGRAHALVLGLVAAVALLAAFHEAWDMTVFAGLIWGGAVALIAAVTCDLRLGARGCRLRWSGAG